MVDGIQELVTALQSDSYDTNKTYSAEVSRIDNQGNVWVYLEGSTKETPTASTSAEIKAGDLVNVEWRNNKLYIAGNVSNPSAGVVRVKGVEEAARVAKSVADEAKTIAGNTNQYFWFTSTGSDTGAHISEVPQDVFTDSTNPNYHKGGNLLARSNGIAVRDGLEELATFSASGAQIGKDDGPHTVIDSDGMQIYARQVGSGGTIAQLANIGYGEGYDQNGNLTYAPFYSVGKRVEGSAVGNYSFASGADTVASGYASTALGYHTIASDQQQVAIGYGNKEDADSVFIIGDGYYTDMSMTELVRHNAFTVGKRGLLKVEERKLFAIETFTWDNQQVEAGATGTMSIPCYRAYWIPLCIRSLQIANATQQGKNCSDINAYSMHLSGSGDSITYNLWYRNKGTATARIKIVMQILYLNTSVVNGSIDSL